VSRPEQERLLDILAVCEAIASYIERESLDNDVRVRLIEIGEAVKDLSSETRALEPGIPWQEIAWMRDHLAHRYFDTAHSLLRATAERDVPDLVAAVRRMLSRR